jgi:hypothetical protein
MKKLCVVVALLGCGGDDYIEPPCEPGHACTWLGIPSEVGFTPDGYHRRQTTVYWTMDTLFARDGVVWFIDWNNHLVRKVMPDGKVQTAIGWTDPVFPGDGNLEDPAAELTPQGDVGTNIQLNHPTDLLEQADGSVLVMAWHNHKIRRIEPSTGRVTLLTGGGPGYIDGPLETALFRQPSRFAMDDAGRDLYVVDQSNQRIRKIDMSTRMVSTIAGTGAQGFSGDDGPALDAELHFQAGSNPEPSGGIAYADNKLYIADTENNRIRRIDLATGIISTIAGTGEAGYAGDLGVAIDARLNRPRDLEIGPDGRLYVADTDNGAVRAVDLATGIITTVVGVGTIGYTPDVEHDPTRMMLHRTFGIDFDLDGALAISDSLNSRIVKVSL